MGLTQAPSSTNSEHIRLKAANLVKQNSDTETSDSLRASDISYIPTREDWPYLAVTLDLCRRKVIGRAFSDRLVT